MVNLGPGWTAPPSSWHGYSPKSDHLPHRPEGNQLESHPANGIMGASQLAWVQSTSMDPFGSTTGLLVSVAPDAAPRESWEIVPEHPRPVVRPHHMPWRTMERISGMHG